MDQLGKKLGTYGTSWMEILRYFILLGICGYAMAFTTILTAPILGVLYIVVFLIIYLMVMLVLEWKRPQLVLYEQGVVVVRGQEEQTWYWRQITRMKGTRTTHMVYGFFPAIRYGANHFYSSDVRAFSVGVLMKDAAQVADFIISKLTEQQIPQQLERIKKGTTLTLGQVKVNDSGIGNSSQLINWQDIKAIHIQEGKYNSVSVERHSDKRRVRLGNVAGTSNFLLMGIADAKLGTQTLNAAQTDRLHLSRRVAKQSRQLARTAGIVIPLSLAAIIGISAVYGFNTVYQAQQQQVDRQELVQLYGGSSDVLCDASQTHPRRLAPVERIVVVNKDTQTIYKSFQDSLEIDDRATGKDDLTLVACLKPIKTRVEDCHYEDRQSYYKQGVYRFNVGRYRQDFEVAIVDPQTHMTVAEDYLMGAVDPCADTANDSAKDTVGPLPDSSTFMELINRLRGEAGSSM